MRNENKNETGEQNGNDRNLEIKPGTGTDNRNPDKDHSGNIAGPTGNPHNLDTDPNGDNKTAPDRPV